MRNKAFSDFLPKKERNLSNFLAFVSIILISQLGNSSFGNTIISPIIVFVIFAVLFILLERIYRFILRTRNIEVGFIAYITFAAVLATINTFLI